MTDITQDDFDRLFIRDNEAMARGERTELGDIVNKFAVEHFKPYPSIIRWADLLLQSEEKSA